MKFKKKSRRTRQGYIWIVGGAGVGGWLLLKSLSFCYLETYISYLFVPSLQKYALILFRGLPRNWQVLEEAFWEANHLQSSLSFRLTKVMWWKQEASQSLCCTWSGVCTNAAVLFSVSALANIPGDIPLWKRIIYNLLSVLWAQGLCVFHLLSSPRDRRLFIAKSHDFLCSHFSHMLAVHCTESSESWEESPSFIILVFVAFIIIIIVCYCCW